MSDLLTERRLVADLLTVSRAALIGVPLSCLSAAPAGVLFTAVQGPLPAGIRWGVLGLAVLGGLCLVPAVVFIKRTWGRSLWWPVSLCLPLVMLAVSLDGSGGFEQLEAMIRMTGSGLLWRATVDAVVGFAWFSIGLRFLEQRRPDWTQWMGFAAAVGLKAQVLTLAAQLMIPFLVVWPLLLLVEVVAFSRPRDWVVPEALKGLGAAPVAVLFGYLGGLVAYPMAGASRVAVEYLVTGRLDGVVTGRTTLPAEIVAEAVWSSTFWWTALLMLTVFRRREAEEASRSAAPTRAEAPQAG